MKLKKTMTAFGALTVAVAALASPAAAFATEAPEDTSSNTVSEVPSIDAVTATGDRLEGPYVTRSDVAYYAIGKPIKGTQVASTKFTKLSQAIDAAETYNYPAYGETGQIRGTGRYANICLERVLQGANTDKVFAEDCDALEPQQQFSWIDADSEYYGKGIGLAKSGTKELITTTWSNAVWTYPGAYNTPQVTDGVISPVAPVVAAVDVVTPAAGSTETTANPVFSGTGEKDATVVITDASGAELARTTVGSDKTWTVPSAVALPNGAVTATATQTSGTSVTTDSTSFTVNVAPAPVTPIDLTSPGLDEVVSTTKPVFKGTGQAGADVAVRGSSGKVLATGQVKADGTWEAQSTIELGDGKYAGTATQVSGSSTTTDTFRYEIKTVAQTPVRVTAPALDGSVATARPVFEGKGTPGASIEVKGNSGRVVASGTVDANGNWTATAMFDLAVGNYVATAFQNANGTQTQAPIRYSIVSTVKVATPVKDSTINTPNPVFSGTGAPGAAIDVKGSSGRSLGTTTVGADGTWSVTSTIALGNGEYVGKAFQTINGLTVSDAFHYFIQK